MAKYQDWNEKKIREQFENAVKHEYTIDYYALKQIAKKSFIIFPKTKIDEEKETSLAFKDFIDPIERFSLLYDETKDYKSLPLNEMAINQSLLLSFTHDFYSSLKDKEINKAFQKAFKDRKDNFKFSSERSTEIFLPGQNYAYLRSTRENTIEDFTNIIHEYGHAVADFINYQYDLYAYPFIELPSLFFTTIALDKLNDCFTNLTTEINNYKKIEVETMTLNARNIKIFEQIMNYYARHNISHVRMILKRKYSMNKEEIRYFLKKTNEERYAYVIPFLVSIELYELYQSDPELALYKLKQIIIGSVTDNYLKELEKLDIELNKNSEKYVRDLKK